jgi:23S rRNA pseudouridine1911/1915/1917 synthase
VTIPARDVRSLPVPEGLEGMRVDAALARLFGFSRTVAATLVDEGAVRLDGREPSRSDRVAADTWLEVTMPAVRDAVLPPPVSVSGMTIVHDDADIVVVDKPAGVAAHPSPGWEGPTVTQGLAALGLTVATSGAAERQGVVHRLDAGTTGLMVVAKSERAYSLLKQAFRERTVEKRYRTLVQGHPDPTSGTIDAPIDRHPGAQHKFAVVGGGRPSVTHYTTLEAFRAATLLDVKLETGRTHQIRVHMAAVRHPCCGDTMYGADPVLAARLHLTRQWLHAATLGFAHPATEDWVTFVSPDPPDLVRALAVVAEES